MSVQRIGPKWLEINLGHLSDNLKLIQSKIAPAQVIPVIKANAYGHGDIEIARHFEKEGIQTLAVATLEEAIRLRQHFIRSNILIFGAIPASQISECLIHKITPTVCTQKFAEQLNREAQKMGTRVSVHLYVDTGMGRMGYPPQEARKLVETLKTYSNIDLFGVYSHYSVSDEEDEASIAYTKKQWRTMRGWLQTLSPRPMLHMANSAGIVNYPESAADAVRPGLILYGISPRPGAREDWPLKPILQIKCRPLFSKVLDKGSHIGYGRSFHLKESSRILTLPIGYADGIPWRLSHQLRVKIGSQTFPLAGRICMDMMMVNLGNQNVDENAEVTLLGDGPEDLYEWARLAKSIPYEILTGLGRRWDRYYLRPEGSPSVWRESL